MEITFQLHFTHEEKESCSLHKAHRIKYRVYINTEQHFVAISPVYAKLKKNFA